MAAQVQCRAASGRRGAAAGARRGWLADSCPVGYKAPTMTGFERDAAGAAMLGGARLADLLAAAKTPTPAYVYDLDAMAAGTRALVGAFGAAPSVVAYAVKANTAGSVVRALAREGAGADVVSAAELEVALGCGVEPARIVMSGVAKSDAELDRAIAAGIHAIQLESVEEIARVAARARSQSQRARVSLRINPGIEIDSHAHVATGHDEAKFGIVREDLARAWELIDREPDALSAVGVSTHVGSMLETPAPYLESAQVVCDAARARLGTGHALEFVDFGGGFAIDYGQGPVQPPSDFARAALELLAREGLDKLELIVEPGRALVAPHGVLVARVLQGKHSGERRWVMLDAGMNDLIRPALYQAVHRIEPLERPPGGTAWRVVGPVCESADDFGAHALGDPLPEAVVIRDAGAYGFVMASEYNGRALPAELFASGGKVVKVSPSAGARDWVERRLRA
jgi:diaminopimelate decarboxylase